MEILGTEIGLTYSHKALRAQIEASGWTVTKVKFDSKSSRYVAEAKDLRGRKLERKGKTEQLALSNLLIAIHHRTSSTHLGRWTTTFTDQLEEIAQAYSKAPLYETKASAAFMALAQDCQRRVSVLKNHLQIQVVPDPEPYKTVEQLSKDVRKSRKLKVSRAGADHPIWTEQQVIDYRICHDVFGYVASGAGWDWPGENLAFDFHVQLVPEEAQKALFTESIAATAYAAYYRAYGQQKIVLFPQFMDKAQEKNNPYKGHPGVHPSQTLPAGPEPSVKHIVEGSFIPGIDEPGEPENVRFAATGTGTIDPTLADPNVGWESPYLESPMTTANGLTIQQAEGDPLESAKVSENANLINTSNSPSTGAQPGVPNSGTEWAYLNREDPTQLATMKRAIVNAFRVVLLSPRKDLRWNAIHYQDISHIPGDESNPKVYWDTLEQKRQDWNEARGYDRYAHLPYMKQMPALVNTLYQKNPSRGFPYAQRRAAEMVQNWITEEQNKQLALDEDKPESKRRQSFQIDTKANYELTKRLQIYLAEHKPNLDHLMTKKVNQRIKDEGLDSKQFLPTLSAALDESPEDIHEPEPAADLSKYGAFMGEHLKAIAKVSQYVDQILEAALTDVHQHDGTGFHFRSRVLQLNIPGVGPKVCSFAWLLLQPMTSELATIDTHMMDLLGHQEKEMNNRDYFGMERELRAGRDAAGYAHMPMGQFQWGCFVPGTLVRTRSGFKAIETIVPGEEVLTAQGRWKPVRKTMSRQFDGELVQLTTNASVRPILTTDEHPFLTLKGHHKNIRKTPCRPASCADHNRDPVPNHYLDWTYAENLSVGDWFPLTTSLEVEDRKSLVAPNQKRSFGPCDFELTPDFLWLCGLYIAEGSCEENRVEWALNGNEKEYQDRIIAFADKHGYGYDMKMTPGPNGGGCRVRINSRVLAQWFPTLFGHGSHGKRIPDEMLRLPTDKLRHLAQGIFDGDGKKATNAIEQTSLTLALQLVEVAARLGSQPTTSRYLASNSTYVSDVYRVHEPITAKRSVRNKPDVWRLGEWDLRKITAIDRVKYHGPVFNLSIEDDETYVVENVPVHNCWDYKRTGVGSHQDHSAMAVLDPKPHTSIDWAAKEQPINAGQAAAWKNMWQTNPPDWWKQTLPARQQAWDEFQATTAKGVGKSKVPYTGLPDGYSLPDNSDGTTVVTSRVASWPETQRPWIVHPRSGEMLHGQPGQSIMSHALGALSVTDPREVWSQLPDEMVGRTTYSLQPSSQSTTISPFTGLSV